MSKAPGKPLASFGWDDNGDLDKGSRPFLTLQQKQKVIRQLGKMHASLSSIRFDRIGSLLRVEDDYTLGKCLSPALMWHGRDEFDGDDIPLGPFDDAASFYRAQTFALLAHVRELPMEHHMFHAPVPTRQEYDTFSEYYMTTDRWNDYVTVGSKIESAKDRLDYTLTALAILELVPLLAERDNKILGSGFPLFHPDLSTSNLFVDDDLNVTCIIDWACTSSVPKSMLLVCPGLPHSRNPTPLEFIACFTQGFVEGKGFDAQADLPFEKSNDLWEFARLVNMDSIQDFNHLWQLFQSLAPGQELFAKLNDLKERDEFITSLKMISQYTATSEEMRNEKQYFKCNGPERLALARHISTMASLNPNFVADQRLWKWVVIHLKQRDTYMFPNLEKEVN